MNDWQILHLVSGKLVNVRSGGGLLVNTTRSRQRSLTQIARSSFKIHINELLHEYLSMIKNINGVIYITEEGENNYLRNGFSWSNCSEMNDKTLISCPT